MFRDLADSTALASRLDPEDLHEVVRAYQQTYTEVIQRFDGHIAQYLGDGLLVYCGYPQAHEDDALLAVQSGLEIVKVPHIYSLSFALCWAAVLHHCLRQRDVMQEQAAELIALCTQYGLPLYLAFGTIVYGRACAAQGQSAQGIVQMRQGITKWQSMEAEIMRTYMLALLADAYREAGQM
jgi:hypothetical protein